MKKARFNFDHIIIFFVSLFCIALELFLTRILNLKAWNHVVYTVIPFAILGYGIGANTYLIFKNYINQFSKKNILGCLLVMISLFSLMTVIGLIYMPIRIEYVLNIFVNVQSIFMLLLAYTVFMIPFVLIGFLVVYLFTNDPEDSPILYFFDLVGAGMGAVLFFVLINHFAVFHSLLFLSLICLSLSLCLFFPNRKAMVVIIMFLSILLSLKYVPEVSNYTVDKTKGWEWIPGYFSKDKYEHLISDWHALGRTDIYRITDAQSREELYTKSPGTFSINVAPRPEFSYISTNFLAGTPVYKLSKENLTKIGSRIKLFTQSMEAPYKLLKNPRVLVIGVGGGRDLFIAKSHGATRVTGAEINPGIVRAMSAGGAMYDYSGGVYTLGNTEVHLIDGRTLVKKFKPKSVDLIILNGVDTFSGLSSGAYAYAESYLYTKNALVDYLRILDDDGIIHFNRWLFVDMPRETLRLHTITLDALKTIGAERPWDHTIIGSEGGWGLTLIKKTPYTDKERSLIFEYFRKTNTKPIYPKGDWSAIKGHPLNMFDYYAEDFKKNLIDDWHEIYPYDISVITDDSPFFYKYYKLASFNPFKSFAIHHTGTVIFLTQLLILLQALIFIFVFIFLPLYIFKKNDIKSLQSKSLIPFVVFFGCLGSGFMFIEISLMQRFVLLLGSPIYSITVVLSVLLISTGVGSMMLSRLQDMKKSKTQLLTIVTVGLALYALILVFLGTNIYDQFIGFSFPARVALVSGILFPMGFALGLYFPSGLQLIGQLNQGTIPWAWGINMGFSALGSILSIILAQFLGFNTIIILAIVIYFIGLLAFRKLEESFRTQLN